MNFEKYLLQSNSLLYYDMYAVHPYFFQNDRNEYFSIIVK